MIHNEKQADNRREDEIRKKKEYEIHKVHLSHFVVNSCKTAMFGYQIRYFLQFSLHESIPFIKCPDHTIVHVKELLSMCIYMYSFCLLVRSED